MFVSTESSEIKSHGAGAHRGLKTNRISVSGRQAHSEDVNWCFDVPTKYCFCKRSAISTPNRSIRNFTKWFVSAT
jgi:hypothetical protein